MNLISNNISNDFINLNSYYYNTNKLLKSIDFTNYEELNNYINNLKVNYNIGLSFINDYNYEINIINNIKNLLNEIQTYIDKLIIIKNNIYNEILNNLIDISKKNSDSLNEIIREYNKKNYNNIIIEVNFIKNKINYKKLIKDYIDYQLYNPLHIDNLQNNIEFYKIYKNTIPSTINKILKYSKKFNIYGNLDINTVEKYNNKEYSFFENITIKNIKENLLKYIYPYVIISVIVIEDKVKLLKLGSLEFKDYIYLYIPDNNILYLYDLKDILTDIPILKIQNIEHTTINNIYNKDYLIFSKNIYLIFNNKVIIYKYYNNDETLDTVSNNIRFDLFTYNNLYINILNKFNSIKYIFVNKLNNYDNSIVFDNLLYNNDKYIFNKNNFDNITLIENNTNNINIILNKYLNNINIINNLILNFNNINIDNTTDIIKKSESLLFKYLLESLLEFYNKLIYKLNNEEIIKLNNYINKFLF